MIRTRIIAALTFSVLLLSAHSLQADVRTDQKTHFELAGALGKIVNIFGGKAAREGVTSTVALKGSRKITTNDATGQIIDLSEEKVYDLDMRKKTYKVTTFAELRKRMEDAQRRAEENAQKEQASQKSAEPARDPNQKDVEIDFDVKNTGDTKVINGFDTHEAIATITVREKGQTLEQGGGLVMTTDMWLAPTIAEMKELAAFDMKYAQALYGPMVAGASPEDMAAAMAMYPMMKQAMGKMTAEGGKINGTPIMTTITTESVKSADQMAQDQQAKSDADSSSSGSGGIGGRLLGGLAKKVAAKKSDDQPSARSTIMTGTTEVLKVTTSVSADDVAIPAGFKENK